ncbi:MAG TPA: aldolase/citrate lyase family protein [Bryobacteraceae bacterium]|nr:aldolase/citrate lyase family protein [Bryobacteraceae bacterium]
MTNILKERLRGGALLAGSWLNSGSAVAAEIAAQADLDWLLIDREHGAGSEADVAMQLLAVEAGGSAAVVRAAGIDAAELKRILDLGPAGVMIPTVDTEAQAREVVRFTRIAPLGERQTATSTRAVRYGRDYARYLRENNGELLAVVQIESRTAVANAGAIAAVEGVDVLFVGPTDLGMSMGVDPNEGTASFREALAEVVAAAHRAGKWAGILARNEEQAREFWKMGFQMIAMGSDRGILAAGFDRAASALAALRSE